MATKAKKRVHPMPKLGWKDQLLYWIGLTLTLSGSVFCVFFPLYFRSKLISENVRVFASSDGKGSFHFIWLSVVLLFLFLSILFKLYNARIPVFGRKSISYGPPAYPRVYPLLMKNKPKHWISASEAARKKRMRIIAAIALIIVTVVSMILYPRSLYGRNELYEDGTVAVYDTYNSPKHYAVADMESVSLELISIRRGWTVGFVFTFSDGETCIITIPKSNGDWSVNLLKAQQLKKYYGPILTIDADGLWKVVLSQNADAVEKDLLYALFDVN